MGKELEQVQLMEYIFDLYNLEQDISKWSLNNFTNNPPRLIRYKRILSLLNAYKLLPDNKSIEPIKYFVLGGFLEKKNIKLDETKITQFKKIKEKSEYSEYFKTEYNSNCLCRDITIYFELILELRIKINTVKKFSHNSFMGIHYYKVSINEIMSRIEKELEPFSKELDIYLAEIYNPDNLVFTLKDLINEYNYPTDDLDEIDGGFF